MRFKKQAAALLLVLVSKLSFGQTDSLQKVVSVTGNVQITNNGIAPVPVFALGRPAISSSTTIKKGNFYFNPEFNLGLDFKPWTINTKLGYILVNNKKLTLGTAVNINFFFRELSPLNNYVSFELQRYSTEELNGEYRFSENRSLQFQYWRSDRLDKIGVPFEDFIMGSYGINKVALGSKVFINIKPAILYLHDKDTFEGLFVAQTTNFQQINWKWNVFFQTIVPINAVPASSFLWNTGINMPF